MSKSIALKLVLDADTGKVVGGLVNVEKELKKLDNASKKAGGSSSGAFNRMSKSAKKSSSAVRELRKTVLRLGGAYAALRGVANAIDASNRIEMMRQQMKLYTASTKEAVSSFQRLSEISDKVGVSLASTVKLFQQVARSAPQLGVSNEQTLQAVENLQKLGYVSGATQYAMANAMLQLGQSMAMTTVHAEEFNSVIENTPEIARTIADGMHKTVSELQVAVVNGKVLSKNLLKAILEQTDKINKKFAEMPRTVGAAWAHTKNESSLFFNTLDKELGLSRHIAATLDYFGESFHDANKSAIELKKTLNEIGFAIFDYPIYIYEKVSAFFTAFKKIVVIAFDFAYTKSLEMAARTRLAFRHMFADMVGHMIDLTKAIPDIYGGKAIRNRLYSVWVDLESEDEGLAKLLTHKQQLNIELDKEIKLNKERNRQADIWLKKQRGEYNKKDREFKNEIVKPSAPEVPAAKGDWAQMLEEQTREFDESTNKLREKINSLIDSTNKFGESWKDTGNKIIDAMGRATASVSKYYSTDLKYAELINKAKADGGIETKKIIDLEKARAKQSIESSIDMLDASVNMYKKGSDAQKAAHNLSLAMHAVEMANQIQKAIAAATVAVATQGSGDPYTAFARIAAMSAMMGGLLSQIGASFSGIGGAPSAVKAQPVKGAGVLGGGTSESLKNTFDLMINIQADQYEELRGIFGQLEEMNRNLVSVTSTLYSTNDLNGLSSNTSKYVQSSVESLINGATDAVQKVLKTIPLIGGLAGGLVGIIGGASNAIATGLGFGGTKKSTSDYGIKLSGTMARTGISGYETIRYSRDGGWFHKSKTWYEDHYKSLSGQSKSALSSVFRTLRDAFKEVGNGLGRDVSRQVDNFRVSIGKISMKGSSADIQKRLQEAFSRQSDKMAYSLFPDLIKGYRKVNESAFDTLGRLIVDKAVVGDILSSTGHKFIRNAIALSESLIKIAGGLDKLKAAADNFFDKFYTEEEKAAKNKETLVKAFKDMNLLIPKTREEYKRLVEGLNLEGVAGASERQKKYVQLLKLSDAADEYYTHLEKVKEEFKTGVVSKYTNALKEQENAISNLINGLKTLKDQLDSVYKSIMGTVVPDKKRYVVEQRKLEQQLALARAGKSVDQDVVKEAITVLQQNKEDDYGSLEEFKRAQVYTAGLIKELSQLTGRKIDENTSKLERITSAESALGNAKSDREIAKLLIGLMDIINVSQSDIEKLKPKPLFWTRPLIGGPHKQDSMHVIDRPRPFGLHVSTNRWLLPPQDYRRVRQFAKGGIHNGGLRIVGEEGPELEFTGPSKIVNAKQTQALLAGAGEDMGRKLDAIIERMERLEGTTRAVGIEQVKHAQKVAKVLTKWDYDGQPEVRVSA